MGSFLGTTPHHKLSPLEIVPVWADRRSAGQKKQGAVGP